MKVEFLEYNDTSKDIVPVFSLLLDNNKLVPSNETGQEFLAGLEAMYAAGMITTDARLYAQGKYEELMKFFVEHYINFYLMAREVK